MAQYHKLNLPPNLPHSPALPLVLGVMREVPGALVIDKPRGEIQNPAQGMQFLHQSLNAFPTDDPISMPSAQF